METGGGSSAGEWLHKIWGSGVFPLDVRRFSVVWALKILQQAGIASVDVILRDGFLSCSMFHKAALSFALSLGADYSVCACLLFRKFAARSVVDIFPALRAVRKSIDYWP